MKILKILTLSLITIVLFTACTNKNDSIKSPYGSNEKIELVSDEKFFKMSDNEFLSYMNWYNFGNFACGKINPNVLKQNFGKQVARLNGISENDLTEADLKRFFISSSAKEGLMGDKSKVTTLIPHNEFRRSLLLGTHKNKFVAILVNDKTTFFFENEDDCRKFINKKY